MADALLKEQRDPSRIATDRRTREAFGFRNSREHLQHAGCLKSLRTLDADGQIKLPVRQENVPMTKPRLQLAIRSQVLAISVAQCLT